MRIAIVTPAAPVSRHGNRVTAVRWAIFLRADGHEVSIDREWDGSPVDLLLALHARRSHDSIKAYAGAHPGRPLIVALTGTDLYRDLPADENARESLRLATRVVVLHDLAARDLPPEQRDRIDVVIQSAQAVEPRARPASGEPLDVLVIGHLREEKDPFRPALAAALLPNESRIRVLHAGGAHDPQHADEARSLERRIERYRWLGEVEHGEVGRLLAGAWALVHPSVIEGGANAVSEALAAGLPVVASNIPGNLGLLGEDHPGAFPAGDEQALAALLTRLENRPDAYDGLWRRSDALRERVRPESEAAALGGAVDRAVRTAPATS